MEKKMIFQKVCSERYLSCYFDTDIASIHFLRISSLKRRNTLWLEIHDSPVQFCPIVSSFITCLVLIQITPSLLPCLTKEKLGVSRGTMP